MALTFTNNLMSQGFDIRALITQVIKEYKAQPNTCYDGGNDKYFFSFKFLGTKLFAAANEVGGLTVMLPEDY